MTKQRFFWCEMWEKNLTRWPFNRNTEVLKLTRAREQNLQNNSCFFVVLLLNVEGTLVELNRLRCDRCLHRWCTEGESGNPECLKAIRDLRAQTRGSAHLAHKQAYYKKLKLDPSGVECPPPWNSEATAVSVVGGNAPLGRRSDQDKPGRQAHLHCLD